MENGIAIYPRIIIDDSFIEGMKKDFLIRPLGLQGDCGNLKDITQVLTYEHFIAQGLGKVFIAKDFDWFYINYLGYWGYMSYIEKRKPEDYDLMSFLKQHKDFIESNLKTYRDKKNILQKYLWCKGYHNSFCKANSLSELEIK